MSTDFLVAKNFASSYLAEDINASVTEFTVATNTGDRFPATFPFHVVIDDEIIEVAAVDGMDTKSSCTRGAEGTTAAAHVAGAEVKLCVTAEYISELQEAVNTLEGQVLDPDEMPNLTLGDGTADMQIELYDDGGNKAKISVNGSVLEVFGPGDTSAALFYDGHMKLQGGSLLGPTDGDLKLASDKDIEFYLDYDNDTTGSAFRIYNGPGYEIFSVNESGQITIQRKDAGTSQESTVYQVGAARTFYWSTLSSNLRLLDSTYGEVVRFNFSGTRFPKDLKPLYNWDSATSPANLGSDTEIWLTAFVKNIKNYGELISPPQTLDTTTTPSVANGRVFKVPVLTSAAVDIGAFDDSVDGQEIILLGVAQTYAWTIYATNSFAQLDGTWVSAAGASLHLIKDGVNWREISRK